MMPNKERLCGLIVGAMAGDCLGNPYIYMKACALFDMGKQFQWQIGMPGECSYILAWTLDEITRRGAYLKNIANIYRKWAQTGHDVGYIFSECFGHQKKKASELKLQAQYAEYGTLCSGMLLLRQIPWVCVGLEWSDEKMCEMVKEECMLTHSDEVCIEYAQLYALCLRDILLNKSRLEIWDHLFAMVRSREVYKTLLSSYYEKPMCDGTDYSHVSVTFGMAFYHFWHHTPVSCAIRSAILAGGSTDVNASATGALCGAFQGIDSIPESWRDILFTALEPPHNQLAPHTMACIDKLLLKHAKGKKSRQNVAVQPRVRPCTQRKCAPYAQGA